jgi:hypothetical protein
MKISAPMKMEKPSHHNIKPETKKIFDSLDKLEIGFSIQILEYPTAKVAGALQNYIKKTDNQGKVFSCNAMSPARSSSIVTRNA